MRAVYVTTYNCENNIKSTLNSVHLLRPCSLWSVFTHFLLIYLPVCCPLFLPLSPNLSFCFSLLRSSVLYPVVPPRPHASHTLTQESKSSSNLFSPFSSFYHYIPPSTWHLCILLMALFPRKMALLVKITHTLNHQNILGQHKALMFSKS